MNDPRLFDDSEDFGLGRSPFSSQEVDAGLLDASVRIRNSSLWAAYGDALGWISELTSESGLNRRTGGAPLSVPIEWKRRIGGRAGVTVTLPRGCYSDDTQLRLATSRCIRSDGFDVEAFSKVELPVWLSYALGGGKSTSAAATNLAKPRVQWFVNDFRGWTDSGGNGAAMRIQPHVWAARNPSDPATFLPDVVRNAVCTHSHPNGMLGAIFHALILARAMVTGLHPTPEDLLAATDDAENVFELFQGEVELQQFWRVAFERDAGEFGKSWSKALNECQKAILVAASTSNRTGADRYETIVDSLMLREPGQRGNGMLTSVAAVALIWCESHPEPALRLAANAIGTDTDTIATMAGAILGINADSEPPVAMMDEDVLRFEADRLFQIASGGQPQNHPYPDLLSWSAPKTRADALVRSASGNYFVRGLGRAELQSDPIPSPKPEFLWQWVKIETGQTLLIKRRKDLAVENEVLYGMPLVRSSAPLPKAPNASAEFGLKTAYERDVQLPHPARSQGLHEEMAPSVKLEPDLEAMLDFLVRHKHDDRVVGQAIRRVVNRCTVGQIGAFLAAVVECLKEPQIPPTARRR